MDGRDIFIEVEEASGRGTLWSSGRDLVIELGTMLPLDHGRVERAVEGQVSLARRRGRLGFVSEVRKYGHQILSDSFIKRVLAGPEKQRRTPGASLSGRPRGTVELSRSRPKPAPILTALDFPALPAQLGSEGVKVEPGVESLVPNPSSLDTLVLPVGSECGRVKVEPEEEAFVSDSTSLVVPESPVRLVEVKAEPEGEAFMASQPSALDFLVSPVRLVEAACKVGPEEGVIIISDEEDMEVDAPLAANLDQEIVGEPGFARPIDEMAEPAGAMSLQGRMIRGMDRCERRSRPLDRGAEFNGGVGTRDRSRSQQDDVGFKRKKTQGCPVCGLRARSIRHHVEARHFPPVFRREAWENPEKDHVRFRGVICVINSLGLQSFDEAMLFVGRQRLSISEQSCLNDKDQVWLERVSRRFMFYIPPIFHVARVNSRALLFHWRVLAALLKLCSQEVRDDFFAQRFVRRRGVVQVTGSTQATELMQRSGPDCCVAAQATGSTQATELVQGAGSDRSVVMEAQATVSSPEMDLIQRPEPVTCVEKGAQVMALTQVAESVPEPGSLGNECELGDDFEIAPVVQEWISVRNAELTAFDSHFHLDRSYKTTKVGSIEALVGHTVGPMPEVPVRVNGGVAVFCDPPNYPREYPSVTGFGSAVGVHPKAPLRDVKGVVGQVERELRKDGVVALGEIGLDRTVPEREWGRQEEMFVGLLELACPRRPVILHIRGQDTYSCEASALALRLMQKNVSPTQRIHLHCFTGTLDQVLSWSAAFPRCYFSISGLAARFDEVQKSAVRGIPADRLLVETDSPYLRVRSKKDNTPAYVGEVANTVAQIRKETLREILRTTAENGRRLYNL
ncbi:hypothetical protein DPMN_120399 [Dreissena polymorpha]|uniref:Uncharacterized protein n=2 Tax=Dreissena polymorpha TaxID=45954 RepID=A0A9D3YTA1_DREPO|nr:hypothetical protein DPMN_079536 [Dreissena polymorpha]KAH3726469.1 hypothetical protein DPMN_052336 [Dreissena polymorpha]KAH3818677.1 hypothetical protein DPMN_120399 [Dreissena polymorpha]